MRFSHASFAMPGRGEPLLVASGKGGVGTSTVTALTALAAHARGERVLVVDANESASAQHLLFGARPTRGVWSLATGARPDDVLIELGEGLSLVAGGGDGVAGPGDDRARRAAIARLAQVHPRFDLIVIDGGSRLDTIAALSDLISPSTLLVTSADRLALAANYALVKSLLARRDTARVSVLPNRHSEAVASEACGYLVDACAHFLDRALTVAGVIPDDPSLQAAMGAGMTVRDAADRSPAALAMHDTLSRLIPTSPELALSRTAMAVASSSSRRWT